MQIEFVFPLLGVNFFNQCHLFFFQMMLAENSRVREKIPSAFESLMSPLTMKVDVLLQPGVVSLCWSSTQIETFVAQVYKAVGELEVLVNRVNDILEFRVDSVLKHMSETELCEIPDEEPLSVDKFLQITEVSLVCGSIDLSTFCFNSHVGVAVLLQMLQPIRCDRDTPVSRLGLVVKAL